MAKSIELTMTFEVRPEEEYDPLIDVTLLEVSPRNVMRPPKKYSGQSLSEFMAEYESEFFRDDEPRNCGACNKNGSRLVCDGCAAKDSIDNIGAIEFLCDEANINILDPWFAGQSGTLKIVGHMRWVGGRSYFYDDFEEYFEVSSIEWEPDT